MKKFNVTAGVLVSLLGCAFPALAEETHSHGEADKVEKKSGRKKRQFMCKDCGKPEKNCECKGEGHNPGEKHEHEKKSEEKK